MEVQNPQLMTRPAKAFLPLLLQYIIFDSLLPGGQSDEIRERYRSDDARDTVVASWRRVKKCHPNNGLPVPKPEFETLEDDAKSFSQVFQDRLSSLTLEEECPTELTELLEAASQKRECDKEMIDLAISTAIWFGENGRWPNDMILPKLNKWVGDPAPQFGSDEDMEQQDSNFYGPSSRSSSRSPSSSSFVLVLILSLILVVLPLIFILDVILILKRLANS